MTLVTVLGAAGLDVVRHCFHNDWDLFVRRKFRPEKETGYSTLAPVPFWTPGEADAIAFGGLKRPER